MVCSTPGKSGCPFAGDTGHMTLSSRERQRALLLCSPCFSGAGLQLLMGDGQVAGGAYLPCPASHASAVLLPPGLPGDEAPHKPAAAGKCSEAGPWDAELTRQQ